MAWLLETLAHGHHDGSWLKVLKQLQKTRLLILNAPGLELLTMRQCNDLLKILEDRYPMIDTGYESGIDLMRICRLTGSIIHNSELHCQYQRWNRRSQGCYINT
ncbi:TPA: ATP-binding protein [Salmonella enterica subsp. enterica serovar Enteritidis]